MQKVHTKNFEITDNKKKSGDESLIENLNLF